MMKTAALIFTLTLLTVGSITLPTQAARTYVVKSLADKAAGRLP